MVVVVVVVVVLPAVVAVVMHGQRDGAYLEGERPSRGDGRRTAGGVVDGRS